MIDRLRRLNEKGIALLLTLLLALLVVSLAIGVLLMMTSTTLVTRFHLAESSMSNLAMAGLEQARDTLNGVPNLLPRPTGHDTIELNVPLRDADNQLIPGLTRSTYAGLTGRATGQAGLFTTVLSVISNARGPVVIRRADYRQRSIASFERFYNSWTGGSWNANDAVFGPVHSNGPIQLSGSSPGTRFWGRVTAVNAIGNASNGSFYSGYQTGVQPIPFPTHGQISSLEGLATPAGLVVAGDPNLGTDEPAVRLEFVAIDLNGDGDTADENEGFFRVFRANTTPTTDDIKYVTALRWNNVSSAIWSTNNTDDPNLLSPNCGGVDTVGGVATWRTAEAISEDSVTYPTVGARRQAIRRALQGAGRRCYLGGDRRLFDNQWIIDTDHGAWSRWAGWGATAPAALVSAIAAQGIHPSTDAAEVALTFWPISAALNANSRGVIYVTGSVAVSGVIRGQVTLAANGNVLIADDLIYVQSPNTTCADILGLVSRRDILLHDNNVNTPFRVNSGTIAVFDDSPDETVHGFLLALDAVGGDNLGSGGAVISPEDCGSITTSNRGCRFLVGGVAQQDYRTSYSGSTGWHDQDHYDQCGSINPPPYFPTTGGFTRYRYYEIDPVGFDPVTWFAANQ